MSSKTKSSIPKRKKKSLVLFDETSLNESDDERAYQNYFLEKMEEKEKEDSPTTHSLVRASWDNLRNSRKKNFLVATDNISQKRKRSHSHLSTSEKSIKISSCKKAALEVSPIQVKKDLVLNQDEQFFQLEVQRLIASPANYSFQPVCHNCELFTDTSNIMRCTGVCLRYFHRDCLHYPLEHPLTAGANFQCPDCWTNTYSCILCKKVDKIMSLLYCEIPDCGRLYHRSCLESSHMVSLNVTEDSIGSCPAHHCVSCAREDRASVEDKPCSKLFQCIRCPAAFHDADLCMAAGSVELSLSHVICPRHFEAKLVKLGAFKPVHPDWCFKCFASGAKLHCHFCPSSFHPECAPHSKKYADTKENAFVCHNCRSHRQPRYGEIIFVKVSKYRWWPSEIIHPRNAPMNILKMHRPDGTFPILFLGSQEYQWLSRSRTIFYNVAEKSIIMRDSGGVSKMDRDFTHGLERAAMMHKVFVNILLRHVPLRSITAPPMTKAELSPYVNYRESEPAKRTVKYEPIKTNVVIPPAKIPLRKPPAICTCAFSCQPSTCSNHLSNIECDKDLCLATGRCANRMFSESVKRNLGVYKTNNRGFGLKTMEPLSKNEFIIEYLGEVITKAVSSSRIIACKMKNIKDLYMLRLSGDLIVDAGPKGNLSRYINHSCDPNCRVERWTVAGYSRLGVFADRDIVTGDELTFDYRSSGSVLKEDIFCLCGTVNCSGFLGPDRSGCTSPSKSSPVVSKTVMTEGVAIKKMKLSSESGDDASIDVNMEKKVTVIFSPKSQCQGDIEKKSTPVKISKSDLSKILFKSEGGRKAEDGKVVGNEKESREEIRKTEKYPKTVGKIVASRESLKNKMKSEKSRTKKVKTDDSRDKIIEILKSHGFMKDCDEPPENKQKKPRMKPGRKPSKIDKNVANEDSRVDISGLEKTPDKITKAKESPENVMKSNVIVKNKDNIESSQKIVESERFMKAIQESNENVKKPGRKSLKMCLKKPIEDTAKNFMEIIESRGNINKKYKSLENVMKSEESQIDKGKIDTSLLDVDETIKSQDNQNIKTNATQSPLKMRIKVPSDDTHRNIGTKSLHRVSVDSVDSVRASNKTRDNYEKIEEKSLKMSSELVTTGKSVSEVKIKKAPSMNKGSQSKFLEKGTLNTEMMDGDVMEDSVINAAIDPMEECLIKTDALIDSVNKVIVIKESPLPAVPLPREIAPRVCDLKPVRMETVIPRDTVYESFCFRCFDGGELVLCDKRRCTKTYHLSCIGLKKAPLGTWYCPWHFCDTCGRPSEVFCVQCPSSYCRQHSANVRTPSAGSSLSLCLLHDQLGTRDATVVTAQTV